MLANNQEYNKRLVTAVENLVLILRALAEKLDVEVPEIDIGDDEGQPDTTTPPADEQKEKVYILRNTSNNSLARLWVIEEGPTKKDDPGKFFISDKKYQVPNGTKLTVHDTRIAGVLPGTPEKPLVVLAGQIDNYIEGYDGPDLINELPPDIAWYVTCVPEYGNDKGKELTGVIFNDDDTWVEERFV